MSANAEDIYKDKDEIYYNNPRAELLPFIPAGIKTVLDVGCGSGNFGQALKSSYKCQVWGIEPNDEAANAAKGKLDTVIHNVFLKDLPELQGKKFDAIFFNDVLEHLINPGEALRNCKELLAPDGCIIASIPNIRWYPVVLSLLRYKDFKYQPFGVMDETHLRFFTKKSMIRLFEDQGYKVEKIEGINKNTNFPPLNILNFLLFNTQEDMKYPQFAIVAKLNNNAG
jgi:2-polyprenyl-3-methyl-5-hydroxy-6-metoxy-1,4-benzoquinol methylase